MEQLLAGTVENAKRQAKKGVEMSGQEWLLFLMVSFFLPLVFLVGFIKADYSLLLIATVVAGFWILYTGWNTFCRKKRGYIFGAREEVMKELYPASGFSRVLFKKYCRLNKRERKAELKTYFPASVFMSVRGEFYYYEGTLRDDIQEEKIQVHGFTSRQICELYDDTACYYYDYAIFERRLPQNDSLYEKNRWIEELKEALADKEWTIISDKEKIFLVVRNLPLDKHWEERFFVKEEVEEHAREVKRILTAFEKKIE